MRFDLSYIQQLSNYNSLLLRSGPYTNAPRRVSCCVVFFRTSCVMHFYFTCLNTSSLVFHHADVLHALAQIHMYDLLTFQKPLSCVCVYSVLQQR